MNAVNHAATALIIKKRYREVPLLWLLISVQVMEILWVLFHWMNLEHTTFDATVRFGGDVHLSHMPFSHSVATGLGLGLVAYLILGRFLGRRRAGIAVGLGVVSHLVLDLLTHAPDIPLSWFGGPFFGTGLYGVPVIPLFVELAYGIFVWRYVRGGLGLLAIIVGFHIAQISVYVPTVVGMEAQMPGKPWLMPLAVALQIAITLPLVGWRGKRIFGAAGNGASSSPESTAEAGQPMLGA